MGAQNVKIRLERAVDCEDVKAVEQILDKYPDVLNQPFHEDGVFNIGTRAAWRGDLKMLQMFHRRGGELNKPGNKPFPYFKVNEGYPPIMWVAIRGYLNCLEWLVEEVKVEYNICDSEGLTPLDNAVI